MYQHRGASSGHGAVDRSATGQTNRVRTLSHTVCARAFGASSVANREVSLVKACPPVDIEIVAVRFVASDHHLVHPRYAPPPPPGPGPLGFPLRAHDDCGMTPSRSVILELNEVTRWERHAGSGSADRPPA